MRRVDRAVLVVAAALAGCAESNLAGSFIYMEPYKLQELDCAELKNRAATAAGQRNEKEKLIDKASESAAGTVIGNMVYGPDRAKAHWDQRLYEEQLARKNCNPPPEQALPPPPPQGQPLPLGR